MTVSDPDAQAPMPAAQSGSLNGADFDAVRAAADTLPLAFEGESKIGRWIDDAHVLVVLKPTVFSYTANRAGVVAGSDALRLRISQILWQVIEAAGLDTGVLHVGADYYISRSVAAPPIEVIVKAALIGTPKHIYHGIDRIATRDGAPMVLEARHAPYVRFDWRNPLPHRDECLPLWLADRYIDTAAAQETALRAFAALTVFLTAKGIEMLDICFFISEDGRTVFGEVSPDCMRAKAVDGDLDKDLWRKGKSAEDILGRWTAFLDRVTGPDIA